MICATFLCRSPVAVVRSSADVVALRYVLPVLHTTSCQKVDAAAAANFSARRREFAVLCKFITLNEQNHKTSNELCILTKTKISHEASAISLQFS